MLRDLGMSAAALLALTFAWAGAAKLGRQAETAAGFGELGLGRPGALARAVPLVELTLAVALLAAPAGGAAAALVLLACFSAVLVRALRRGLEVRCACFGRASGPPLSAAELVRNGLLAALAVLALTAGVEPRVPGLVPAAAVALVTAAAFALLAFVRQNRHRSG
jgi:hypothetical protein